MHKLATWVDAWFISKGSRLLAICFIALCAWVAWLQATQVEDNATRIQVQERNDPCTQQPLPVKECKKFLGGLASCDVTPAKLVRFFSPENHRCDKPHQRRRSEPNEDSPSAPASLAIPAPVPDSGGTKSGVAGGLPPVESPGNSNLCERKPKNPPCD